MAHPVCIGIVTGGNRGIGRAAVERLASNPHVIVVLTARDAIAASEAAEEISKCLPQGSGKIVPRALDITEPASVDDFVRWVGREYSEGLDFVVNNAGFAYPGASADVPFAKQAQDTIRINFFGTLRFTQQLAPRIRRGGRLVTVASTGGISALAGLAPELRERILGATTETEATSFIENFLEDVHAGNHVERGWPSNSYGMSKMGLLALTRAWAAQPAFDDIVPCCMCPGWCLTDMAGSVSGDTHLARSAAEGALDVAFLALPHRLQGDPRNRALRGMFVRPNQDFPALHNVNSHWSQHELKSQANAGEPMPPIKRSAL